MNWRISHVSNERIIELIHSRFQIHAILKIFFRLAHRIVPVQIFLIRVQSFRTCELRVVGGNGGITLRVIKILVTRKYPIIACVCLIAIILEIIV